VPRDHLLWYKQITIRCAQVVILISAALTSCQAKRVPLVSNLKMSDESSSAQLLAGFYTLENQKWRWVAHRFAVVLKPPPGSDTAGATLRLQLFLPDPQIQKLGPITLTADVGEVTLKPETFTQGGAALYSRDVAPDLLRADLVPVVFSFDKAAPAALTDGREVAAVVTQVSLDRKN
jgi:hypothetical protein